MGLTSSYYRTVGNKKPLISKGFWTLLGCWMVEAAGVEPASENFPL